MSRSENQDEDEISTFGATNKAAGSAVDGMMVEDNGGGSGALDFSSLVPLCVARKAFNSHQVQVLFSEYILWLVYLYASGTLSQVGSHASANISASRSEHPVVVRCRYQDLAPGLPTANNFLKGASFSPDGTCLLTSSDDTVLRVFEVPDHALHGVRDTGLIYFVLNVFESFVFSSSFYNCSLGRGACHSSTKV